MIMRDGNQGLDVGNHQLSGRQAFYEHSFCVLVERLQDLIYVASLDKTCGDPKMGESIFELMG